MKILVADDSRTNLALIEASLKKLGHETIATLSGEQAIAAFMRQRPDLVILDVVMEGMDGFECAKKIRKFDDEDWIPIIFLSSSVDDESIAKGIDAGGDDYLAKPFSEITLAAKIKAMQRISDMRKKLYEATCQLSVLSSTDVLTGIYNRLQFERTISEKIAYAKRHNTLLALLFLDLDNFKIINDHLGHNVGDMLLKEVAIRLRSCMREYDFIARIGGDEFAIILSDIRNYSEAGSVAQKILTILSQKYFIAENDINISCSIGIACFPFAGTEKEILVRNADIAMYHTKSLGRNNYQFFTQELLEKYKQRTQLESALKLALSNHQLFITYQPIYNLKNKIIVGIEALLHWKHPSLGIIEPDIFAPIAEEVGLTTLFDNWLLRNACEQAEAWRKNGNDNFKLLITVSNPQLLRKDFPNQLSTILLETHLPSQFLELGVELKETIALLYTGISAKIIKKISNLGVGIVIDDLGIGSSSLLNLKELPVSGLKVNKSFLKGITDRNDSSMIAKSIIALGKSMNLKVIAEGIESDQQLQFFIENGCPEGQGNYLKKPLDAEQMTEFFSKKRN